MFRNRKYFITDLTELTRRLKRQFDGNLNYRKILLILFISAILFLYIGPYIFSWLFRGSSVKSIRKSYLPPMAWHVQMHAVIHGNLPFLFAQ